MASFQSFLKFPLHLMRLLSIKVRLMAIIGLALVGYAVAGALSWYADANTEKALKNAQSYSSTTQDILRANMGVLDLRRIEARFLSERKPEMGAGDFSLCDSFVWAVSSISSSF